MRRVALLVATVLGLAGAASCAGDDDGDRKRVEAAEWCEVTLSLDEYLDDTEGHPALRAQITYDRAAEWMDVAPMEIRRSTEQAARILREIDLKPAFSALVKPREEIGAYAAEYCATPARCIADVEGNPRLPCIHPKEARRRR